MCGPSSSEMSGVCKAESTGNYIKRGVLVDEIASHGSTDEQL